MPESKTPPEPKSQEHEPHGEAPREPEPEPRVSPAAEKGGSILDQLRDSFRIRH